MFQIIWLQKSYYKTRTANYELQKKMTGNSNLREEMGEEICKNIESKLVNQDK
ncbi:hypothetical protein SAMN06265367_108149 [Algoriphagus winogradskyi]|uniref:Uncharacterized protein n=1 Tax=Algoriphagus winogradskyi TaxID=237017 RepID=A0ABY1PGS1_9BACT|nr:hypothetical protein SAMN06265367_108149 [Algoriphagus winogradskyi]